MDDETIIHEGDEDAIMPSESNRYSEIADRQTLLSGMYRNWFIEFASYVILERAVPHIEDGLKPVQRRILHSMQTLDDGRFNKVANIVGNTMQYHPHGDASIAEALVQLGQKELLIDTQGNWGNILTGDKHAAPRYIEARLSEFAIETVFNPKITEWVPSYDGRKKEPVTLPVKFPLLLAQGVEGIAVGLSSKILPHNFNEILDAAISYLRNEEFTLYPDFQTGGLLDVSRYNDGRRGGSVKVRAKIEKRDSKTLVITEIPFGRTTQAIIASILAAMEKGKIKIRKVDDNTASTAEIVVYLTPGTSSDKAIDALYAFTDCEVSISPNCCVIWDKKPRFLGVSDVLRFSVDHTQEMLRQELEIKRGEAMETRFFASLEKIFIEERIYKDKEIEEAKDMPVAIALVHSRLEPYKHLFYREVTDDDIMRLWEIKMGRILKFNAKKAEDRIVSLTEQIDRHTYDLEHIVDYTISWYEHLKEKYGERFPRNTQLRNFDSIEATRVAEANKRLYIDREGGFIGTALKDSEQLFTCSDIDDIIVFSRDGKYKVVKVQDKLYVGPDVIHVGLFKKGDKRTVYNVIYRNGKTGPYYKKRFNALGLTRDKNYDLTKGAPGSRVEYFSANPNGEAEIVKVTLRQRKGTRIRAAMKPVMVDFSTLDIKGRDALGNLVTKETIDDVKLKEKGVSTLGGRSVWFDADVLRLNYEGRGKLLGEFQGDDKVLVVTKDGEYYTTDFSDSNHFDDNIYLIEKYDAQKVWTLVLFDADHDSPYLKRFTFDATTRKQRFAGNEKDSRIILLTSTPYPRLSITYEGNAQEEIIEADDFVGVKSCKAKGKRLSTLNIAAIEELEPTRVPEEPVTPEEAPSAEDTADDREDDDENLVQGELFSNM